MVINIDNLTSTISVKEMNDILRMCTSGFGEECEVHFLRPVERIEIAFIGGLFLLHKEKKHRFILYGVGENDAIFSRYEHSGETIQAIAQIRFFSEIYSINPDWISIKGIIEPTNQDIFITPKFAPVFFINKDLLVSFFLEYRDQTIDQLRSRYVSNLTKNLNSLGEMYFREKHENHIISILGTNPPVYAFVYCILHRIEQPFVRCSSLEEAKERILSLFSFTRQYVAGLLELAKNIVEHGETGQGIITIGSYAADDDKSERIVEASVFDLGNCGIVPTMFKKLRSDVQEDVQDREVIKSGYSLMDFFVPGQSKRLVRQIRREMAHLGLIHFVSLIKSNSGRCCLSSGGMMGLRDFYSIDCEDKTFCQGTSYYFSLPVRKGSRLDDFTPAIPSNSVTNDYLKVMPVVLGYREKIRTIQLPHLNVVNREDETKIIEAVSFDSNERVFAIDFEGVTISATGLLRVLASFSERTNNHIIVYNIDSEVYSDMIDSNCVYFDSMNDVKETPFWIKGKAILVYSKLKGHSFYFADLLYGSSTSDFVNVNVIINNTFPNYCSITSDYHEIQDSGIEETSPVRFFFGKSTLLPFDLLIQNQNGEPLFYTNLEMLINKDLS